MKSSITAATPGNPNRSTVENHVRRLPRLGGRWSLIVRVGIRLRQNRKELLERRFNVRWISASNHDLRLYRAFGGSLRTRQVAVLKRDIDARTIGGMGSQTKEVQDAKIAIGDLSEVDGILQSESLTACESHMSRPLPPLRRGEAIEHDERGLRMPGA